MSTSPVFVREDNYALLRENGAARACAVCEPGKVRLPRSTMRRSSGYTFLKLLQRVVEVPGGFLFEGKLLRPGSTILKRALPDPAVLLECCGTEGRRREKGGKAECRFIVWRFRRDWADRQGSLPWEDLAQASSEHGEWAFTLEGVARRALHPANEVLAPFDCEAAVARILGFADAELYGVDRTSRMQVLDCVATACSRT